MSTKFPWHVALGIWDRRARVVTRGLTNANETKRKPTRLGDLQTASGMHQLFPLWDNGPVLGVVRDERKPFLIGDHSHRNYREILYYSGQARNFFFGVYNNTTPVLSQYLLFLLLHVCRHFLIVFWQQGVLAFHGRRRSVFFFSAVTCVTIKRGRGLCTCCPVLSPVVSGCFLICIT